MKANANSRDSSLRTENFLERMRTSHMILNDTCSRMNSRIAAQMRKAAPIQTKVLDLEACNWMMILLKRSAR